ncbi:hypothetical protein MLP_30620 [Microlunatus phosphovorus NM-1]|uniref:Uncharacterized protein n=1 Tax=Microlunatus phosphovorus (strain ATCC 700054 / DSM 10555 / JCM 9379 / NBRC 101784 / NCIMB 13414 / VKM Ac-1990 / NM-1) TaxID=1032480 RepID=F5XKK4_MICPN|nr:hypothetical protein MLP_30620 [Microlunatus phosphovorus NM-1]
MRGAELDEAEQKLALLRPEGQPLPTPFQRPGTAERVVPVFEHHAVNGCRPTWA